MGLSVRYFPFYGVTPNRPFMATCELYASTNTCPQCRRSLDSIKQTRFPKTVKVENAPKQTRSWNLSRCLPNLPCETEPILSQNASAIVRTVSGFEHALRHSLQTVWSARRQIVRLITLIGRPSRRILSHRSQCHRNVSDDIKTQSDIRCTNNLAPMVNMTKQQLDQIIACSEEQTDAIQPDHPASSGTGPCANTAAGFA